ncbi:nucleoside-diphosphate sugar epimerase/dehydratase [Cytophaga hutchinsonii]|uniref:nucleoside-diphosphate sugar epimerase/dehydratase n=1 Tax=Cytophaga hutchinsonii TaxID=985 RepID=UPI00003C88FB|nr:hypothetical protein [Cytophaga hutchinsonii]
MSWIILAVSFNIYIYSTVRRRKLELVVWNLIKIVALHVLIIFTFIGALKESYYSRQMLLMTYLILGISLFAWRLLFILFLNWYRKTGSNFRNVLIIGAGPVGLQVMRYIISKDNSGYRFLGFLDDATQHVKHKELVLGNVDALKEICESRFKIDEIFCTLPFTSSKKIRSIIEYGDNHLIRVHLVPDFRGFLNKKVDLEFYDHVPVLNIRKEPLESIFSRMLKRIFDYCIFTFSIDIAVFMVIPITCYYNKIKFTGAGILYTEKKRPK